MNSEANKFVGEFGSHTQ